MSEARDNRFDVAERARLKRALGSKQGMFDENGMLIVRVKELKEPNDKNSCVMCGKRNLKTSDGGWKNGLRYCEVCFDKWEPTGGYPSDFRRHD